MGHHFVQHLHHINFWPVLVSALALWFLGALWYSPVLFAKPWMAALGIVPNPDMKNKMMLSGMIASLVGDLVMAFIMLHFIIWSHVCSFAGGAFIGFISWLGVFAATQVAQGIYEGKPFKLFLINGAYFLIGMAGMGGLLAVWR